MASRKKLLVFLNYLESKTAAQKAGRCKFKALPPMRYSNTQIKAWRREDLLHFDLYCSASSSLTVKLKSLQSMGFLFYGRCLVIFIPYAPIRLLRSNSIAASLHPTALKFSWVQIRYLQEP